MIGTFTAYDLRTTEVDAAAAFYAAVLGLAVERHGGAAVFVAGDRRVGELSALPEQARRRGAPAHWLGQLAVADVDAAAARLVELGGQRLGPPRRTADGRTLAALKDPLGAVVGLGEGAGPPAAAVAWHELHTTDHERAWSVYAELTSWQPARSLDLEIGPYQIFAAEGELGAMASTARAPHIHTHWLLYFAVADLDAALAAVRALGGTAIGDPMQHPSGARAAPCEDPQGAAFALCQR